MQNLEFCSTFDGTAHIWSFILWQFFWTNQLIVFLDTKSVHLVQNFSAHHVLWVHRQNIGLTVFGCVVPLKE